MNLDNGDGVKTVKADATMTFTYVESDNRINRITKLNKCYVGNLVGLNGEDKKVCIDIGCSSKSDAFLISFSHKSQLPIMSITRKPFTILYQHFSSTMVDHIAFLRSKNILPLFTYQFPNHTETKPNIYKCVSEEFRLFVKGLVDFVLHLHSIGKSLVQLSIENLCILDEQLRIWGIRFRELDDDSAKKDFEFVYNVIRAIFDLGGFVYKKEVNELPRDFDNLLMMMKNWSGSEPVKNHLGLLSAKEKIAFVRNIVEVAQGLTVHERNMYDNALSNSGNNNGWKRKVTWGPMLECLKFKDNDYRDRGPRLYVNSSLIKFCRNAASHLHKDIAKSIHHTRTIESIDLECYIMQHYSGILTNFKNELGKRHIAYRFE